MQVTEWKYSIYSNYKTWLIKQQGITFCPHAQFLQAKSRLLKNMVHIYVSIELIFSTAQK